MRLYVCVYRSFNPRNASFKNLNNKTNIISQEEVTSQGFFKVQFPLTNKSLAILYFILILCYFSSGRFAKFLHKLYFWGTYILLRVLI